METTILKDENLQRLVVSSGMPEERLIKKILSTLLYEAVIELNNKDDWGLTVIQHCCYAGIDFKELLHSMAYCGVNDESFSNVLLLKVIGDGDCPYCGGASEQWDSLYTETVGTYLTPPQVELIWEDRKCSVCKEIFRV